MAGSESAGGASRRRGSERPNMVPLSEFGKAPPAPPKAPLDRRRLAIQVAIAVLVLLAVIVIMIQLQGQVTAFWHGATCLDVRKGC